MLLFMNAAAVPPTEFQTFPCVDVRWFQQMRKLAPESSESARHRHQPRSVTLENDYEWSSSNQSTSFRE